MSTTTTTTTTAQVPANDQSSWAFIEEGVDHLMNRLSQGLSYSKYMALYSAVFNYTNARPTAEYRLEPIKGAQVAGAELYNSLMKFFINHLDVVRSRFDELQGTELLQRYVAEWDSFTMGAGFVNRMFTTLNRNFVQHQRKEGRRTIFQVYTLALLQWKNKLYNPLQGETMEITRAILHLIHKQRRGDTIDQALLKRVLQSFVAIGLDDVEPTRVCLVIYRTEFEHQFLAATDRFYRAEANAYIIEHSIPEYMLKAETRLKEEEDRVDLYLHTTTRKILITNCEHILIHKQISRLRAAFPRLLEFNSHDDIERMYRLCARVKDGLDPLRNEFEQYIKETGLEAVKKLLSGDDNAVDTIEPKLYVDALLSVHNTGKDTVAKSLKNESGFLASLDRACTDYINRNDATGTSDAKSAELLAKRADLLLRKTNKLADQSDLEEELNRVMTIFKFICDKDVFLTFYSTKFSKRLIYDASASDEAEAGMISRLKEACGFEYTNKLQRMFTDMSLSKDLTESFKAHQKESGSEAETNFNVMVLGTNFWPLSPPIHNFIIPTEIISIYEDFGKYYGKKHNGRKLTWLWNHSKNELRTNYLNQRYVLMTSSFQMAVLVQYNRNDSLSLDELVDATAIDKDTLLQVLGALLKAKVLVSEEEHQYDLNPDYKSKKIRINLNQIIKTEVKKEAQEVLKAVDEDRKYVIQATIVRIMKARKTMKNQALVQEVITQISQRFAPQIHDIKKALDTLMEKDYIERVDDTRDTWAYIA